MKKKSAWLFVDLIEDKIKSRWIFVSVSLLFYVYITWRLIVGFSSVTLVPAIIETSLEMQRSIKMGVLVSEQRTPHIKVTNIHGDPLPGVKVTINLVKISSDTSDKFAPI